jgi:hypothetical protein
VEEQRRRIKCESARSSTEGLVRFDMLCKHPFDLLTFDVDCVTIVEPGTDIELSNRQYQQKAE